MRSSITRVQSMIVMLTLAVSSAWSINPTQCLLIINRASQQSLAVGNYYRSKRNIPDQHVVMINWPTTSTQTTFAEFNQKLRLPVLTALKERGIAGRVGLWITTPGIPVQVSANSLSSAIYFGQEFEPVATKTGSRSLYTTINPYFDSLNGFSPHQAKKEGEGPTLTMHMHLDAGGVDATKLMIDRSVQADGSFPAGTVYLLEGEGPRSIRKETMPTVAHMLRSLNLQADQRVGSKLRLGQQVIGLTTGSAKFELKGNQFLPGAIGDNLTSYGAVFGTPHDQTKCTEFLAAGCSASYGTVVEPYNYAQKFPTARLHVYYALGFSAAEAYWMSVLWPQEGLFVGDPLTRPFGSGPTITFDTLKADQAVKGVIDIRASANAGESQAGVAHVEAFLDGKPIGQSAARGFTTNAKIDITVGDRTFTHTTKSNEKMADVILAMQRQFTEAGYMTATSPGHLILLSRSNDPVKLNLSASCSEPGVYVRPLTKTMAEGKPAETLARWQVSGLGRPGDTFTLELEERDKVVAKVECSLPATVDDDELIESVGVQLNHQLPVGYSIVLPTKEPSESKSANKSADKSRNLLSTAPRPARTNYKPNELVLRAEPGKFMARPRAKLQLKSTKGSALKLLGSGDWLTLMDTTLRSYSIGWIRFGFGQDRLSVASRIDTRQLADGRHTISVLATRGEINQSASFSELSFIVQNQPGTVEIIPTTKEQQAGRGMAAVKLTNLNEVDAIRFFIDGQPAGVTQGNNPILYVEPTHWGAGTHRVTAEVTTKDQRTIRSRNAYSFEIAH